MKRYVLKVCINDGEEKQNFYSYMDAESEEEAKRAALEYWAAQNWAEVESLEVHHEKQCIS